jgi:hypothetical protein
MWSSSATYSPTTSFVLFVISLCPLDQKRATCRHVREPRRTPCPLGRHVLTPNPATGETWRVIMELGVGAAECGSDVINTVFFFSFGLLYNAVSSYIARNCRMGRSWREVVSSAFACTDRRKHETFQDIAGVSAEIWTAHFFNSLKQVVTIYSICLTMLKFWVVPTECIYVFRMALTVNSDFLPKQY